MNAYQTAKTWYNLGISTIPVLRGTKRPALSSWKQYQDALPSESDLRAWFDGSGYSIAVITGRGLVIVDFDDMQRHKEWVNGLPAERLAALNTYRVRTARGFHYYWWCKEECNMGPWCKEGCAKENERGIDVKSHGYCLCPPSVHPSGIKYTGHGSIEGIVHIERITDVLVDYKPVSIKDIPISTPPSQRDIFDEAMREHLSVGVSIEAIKERVSIEDLLNLSRVRHAQHTNCPLPGHNDIHASFCIYPDNHWHCYGCNRGGDAITLHSLLHNVSTSDAMRELARKVGL